MLTKEAKQRQAVEKLSTDMLVPKDHLLRKIDAAVDFDHIDELVGDLYSADNGRPGVDPVVLFKLVLVQRLYGIRSLRQTVKDADMSIAYRWFIAYSMAQPIPPFATNSYAFANRFDSEIIERVFEWILEEANEAGYLSADAAFLDGTHIKANANLNKHIRETIPQRRGGMKKQLMEEVNADREAHEKKPFNDEDPKVPKEKTVIESTTDPGSGVFHKREHRKCFAYEAHTVCDKHNFVLDVVVTPGNVHDSVAFDELYSRVTSRFPEIQVILPTRPTKPHGSVSKSSTADEFPLCPINVP